jgi:cytochrome c1
VFAGGIFDLWIDLDGNGEVDISERGQPHNVADLEAWLRDPPGEKPMAADQGRGMPNFNLSEVQINDLVAYLKTLE